MTPTISYNLISKYRTELMGLAVLWIFLFHSKLYFPESVLFGPLRVLVSTGYGGVDIFFFLSGYGLMHHMLAKSSSCLSFYKTRLLKIYPSYLIASIVALGIIAIDNTVSIKKAVLVLTTLGFWTADYMIYWFIPAIISLYVMYPFFYTSYRKHELSLLVMVVSVSIITCGLLVVADGTHFIKLLSRIPVFVLGSHISYLCATGKGDLSKKELFFNLLAFIFFLILLLVYLLTKQYWSSRDYGLAYYPFILGTLPICLFTAIVLEKFSLVLGSKKFKWLMAFLLLCGSASLEIYLIHKQIVFQLGDALLRFVSKSEPKSTWFEYGNYLEYFLYLIVTLLLAQVLKKISGFIRLQLS